MSGKRDFKGIWIPAEIYLDQSLSWAEKILLIEIDSLDNDKEKGCFASNDYLAKFIGVTSGAVANMLTKLKKRGLVKRIYYDGRHRGLRVRFSHHDENSFHKNMNPDFTKRLSQASQKDESIYRCINPDINKVEREEAPAALSEKKEEEPNHNVHTNDKALDLNGKVLNNGKGRQEFEQAFIEMNSAYYWLKDSAGGRLHPWSAEKAYPRFKAELWEWAQDVPIKDITGAWSWFLKNKNFKYNGNHSPKVFLNNLPQILLYVEKNRNPQELWAEKRERVA